MQTLDKINNENKSVSVGDFNINLFNFQSINPKIKNDGILSLTTKPTGVAIITTVTQNITGMYSKESSQVTRSMPGE